MLTGSDERSYEIHVVPDPGVVGNAFIQPVVEGDMSGRPDHLSWLLEQADNLTDENRELFFSRWQEIADQAFRCDDRDEVRWFLHLVRFTTGWQPDPELHERSVENVQRLAVEKPRCFLRGISDAPIHGMTEHLLSNYLLVDARYSPEEVHDALVEPIQESQFIRIEHSYALRHQRYLDRRAREREQKERRRAWERIQYWETLQDGRFYEDDPEAYRARRDELAERVTTCEDEDEVRLFLEAAIGMENIGALQQANARAIEELAMHEPDCLFRVLDEVSNSGTFIQTWLIDPRFREPEEIYAAVTESVEVTNRPRRQYERAYEDYQYEVADPVREPDEFLWSVKYASGGPDGQVFVPATYIKGHSEFQDELDAIWAETPAGDIRGRRGNPVKILPRDALDFMTLNRFGTYYVLVIDREGIEMVRARVVNTALARWACGEHVISLLVLEPDTERDWLTSSNPPSMYRRFAVELRDELPLPEVARFEDDSEDHFQRGRLVWPQAERGIDFVHTQSYVRPRFDVTDTVAGEEHHARRFSDHLCH